MKHVFNALKQALFQHLMNQVMNFQSVEYKCTINYHQALVSSHVLIVYILNNSYPGFWIVFGFKCRGHILEQLYVHIPYKQTLLRFIYPQETKA